MKYQAITAAAILICCFTSIQGQVTDPTNVPNTNHWVGFDGNSTIPLPIENIGYPDINISSNGNNKFAITELPTWNGLNGLTRTNVQRTTLGLQGETNQAWSMLHLWSGEATSTMQRDWMNVGTSYTANIDFMYTGLLERPVTGGAPPRTDAVIAWGCQDGLFDPDNFRFLFLSPTGASGPSSSEQGLETMRISPVGNIGIGDFSSMPTGLNEQPTQKLDVDGTARLRQMPNESPDVIITGVEEDDEGDYRLNYLEFSGNSNDVLTGNGTWINGSGTLCDWDLVNGGDDLAMGYGTACVTEQMLVGTDLQTGTNAKVFMTKDYTGTTLRAEATAGNEFTDQIAGYFKAKGGLVSYGVKSLASSALGASFGVRGEATSSTITYGVSGFASAASQINYGVNGTASGGFGENPPVNNVGVYGRALGYASSYNFGGYFVACDGTKNIGLYAEGCGETETSAHFAGLITISGGVLSLSDESIKNGMNEIESPIDKINQLQPKQYYYNTEGFPHLHLKSELSYGFSAQEMQEVLPEIVGEIYHPAKFDSLGEETSPSEDLLGIHYQELIAILTAGVKEQQSQISEQAQTIDDLQQSLNNQNDLIAQMMDQMDALADQVNNCCDGGLKNNAPNHGIRNLEQNNKSGGNVLDQNTPNPFRSQTTISYSLETGGKVLLNVYNKAGKILNTLEESEQTAGTYRYEWDASGLPAGLYHYALYVDGELLVKKAIKLAD